MALELKTAKNSKLPKLLENGFEPVGKGWWPPISTWITTSTIMTVTIQLGELADPEEGERIFHSQMWVKGTPLHFIVDKGIQKNLISAEVIKQLGLSITPHLQPYNIGWLHQG
jgi:hypothetical protein